MRKLPNGYAKEVIEDAIEKHGPMTALALSELTGIRYDTVYGNLERMCAGGEAHICEYTESGQSKPPSAVFTLGFGINAEKPPKRKRKGGVKLTKEEANAPWVRTPGLQMVYPIKSVFAGGKNPWANA